MIIQDYRINFRKAFVHVCLGAACGVVLVFSLPAATMAQTRASIRPSPATLEVGAGQTETWSIVIEGVKDLYGVEIRAHFDPNVVQVVSGAPSQNGIQLIPGSFVKPDFLVRNQADNAKGTLEFVLTQTNPTPPANGSGTLVSIQFSGKVLGKSSPFIIDHAQFSDRSGKTIPVAMQNGQIAVVQPKPPTPTPVSLAAPALAVRPTTQALSSQDTAPEPEPAAAPRSLNLPKVSALDIALISIGGCGFLGAVLILGAGAIVYLRRSKRPREQPNRYYPSLWR